jgi:hypothetical protein
VPLKATTTVAQYDEADALAAQEAKEEALAELAATPSEEVILADDREVKVGVIVMFVKLEKRTLDGDGMAMVAALLSHASGTDGEVSEETVWERLVNLANNFVDGVLSVFTLKADKVETKELCVDGVCVNANDLRTMLNANKTTTTSIEEVVEDSPVVEIEEVVIEEIPTIPVPEEPLVEQEIVPISEPELPVVAIIEPEPIEVASPVEEEVAPVDSPEPVAPAELELAI